MSLFSSAVPKATPAFFGSVLQREDAPIYVVGAVNMDLTGTPAQTLRPGDSNPGRVTLSPGGVGRNIAENLRLLGRKVSLITVMGNDAYAGLIREHCRNVGIDLQYSLTDPLAQTSTYLCVNESNGDLHAAVADMAIYEQLTPDRLKPLLPVLNHGSMVIAGHAFTDTVFHKSRKRRQA